MSLYDFLEFISNPFRYRKEREDILPKGAEMILHEISILQERTKEMALNLEALTAEVERVKTVQESAVTLLLALASELEEISANLHECHSNTADLEALDALTIKLRESTDALANAIDASDDVISEPEPVVEEPVEPEPVDPEVEEPVDEEPVVEEPTDPEVDPVEEPEAPVEGEGDEAVEDEAVQAPFDASGIPGAEGTQSGEAVDREKE